MKYYYSKGWFRAKKKALALYSAEEAEYLHKSKQLYCVLVGDINRPYAFIEINNDFYGVTFLDDLLRCKLEYQFTLQDNGKLFLNMSVFREFRGSSDNIAEATIYTFAYSGNIVITKENTTTNEVLESRINDSIESNWEIEPEFGNYENLLIIERNS